MWRKFLHFVGAAGSAGCVAISVAFLWAGAALPCTLFAATEIPVISADTGLCSAEFAVSDSNNKPVYNAKVHVKVAFGFMSKRKTDLEIGTNSDGKARIEGLPLKLKKPPLEFTVRSGDQSKSVIQDPAVDCHATFNVQLGK